MSKADGKVIEVCGQEFRIVKNGLDEAEVLSFVSSLIDQNKQLTDKLDNLDSLMEFAQRTVVEATKQAKNLEIEMEQEANAKAASIIAEAKERAEAEADKTIAEAREKAEAEKQRIREEAEHFRVTTTKRVERDIRERFEKVCEEVFSESDYTGETTAISTEDESKTPVESEFQAAPVDEVEAFTAETGDLLASAQEEESKESEDDQDRHAETMADELQAQLASAEQEEDQEEGHTLYQGDVELRISSPFTLARVLQLHRQLKEDPQIEVKSFAVSANEGVRVELHLSTSMPLLRILGALDEVKNVSALGEDDEEHLARLRGNESPVRIIELTVD